MTPPVRTSQLGRPPGAKPSLSHSAAGCSAAWAAIAASSAFRMRAPISGGEPPVQHYGTVVLVPEGEAAILVLGIGPFGLFRPLRSSMEADELLDMLRGAVQSDVEEVGLVPGHRDTGSVPGPWSSRARPWRVPRRAAAIRSAPGRRGLSPAQCGYQCRRPSSASGRTTAPPGPHLAAIELGDEGEKSVCGGVDVSGEGGDRAGEGVVVHGGEIVRRDGMKSSHGIKRILSVN